MSATHAAVQSNLERWGFALPVGNRGQRSDQSQSFNPTDNSASGNQKTRSKKNTSMKTPARYYFNTVKNTKYSIAAYIDRSRKHISNQLEEKAISRRKTQLYGDTLGPKDDGTCRIVSYNINCIGVDTFTNSKHNTVKDWLFQNSIDICGWQEVGVAQHMLQRHEKLAERMRDMRRKNIRMCTANNKNETIDRFQYGGTAVFAFDHISHMVRAAGSDDTELGRWCWLQLEGHRGRRVRVISAYNPCRTSLHSFATVYSQQKRYFNSKHKDVCPRKQFRKDLCAFITSCQNDGESVILLIDTNENLTAMHDLQLHLTSKPLFLIDPIRLRHGIQNGLPPTTDRGSYPIDSIFVLSDLIDIEAGGWLQISTGISDHRPLYIDISIRLLLGKYKNHTEPYTMRRLKCQDMKSVDNYNRILEQQYHHHKTLAKLEYFLQTKSEPLTEQDKVNLFKIDKVCTQAVIHAERKCRHIFAGGRPYTPKLNKLGKIVDTWRMIIKKKLGRHISSKKIQRAAIANGLPHPKYLPLSVCYEMRADAYKNYRTYAKDSKVHRPNFIDQLIEDKIAEGDQKAANRLNQQKLQEEIRHVHRRIKLSTKPFVGAPYHMELQGPRKSYISNDKDQMEQVLITEYDAKYRLAHSSPFLHEPLLSEFGPMAFSNNADKVLDGTYICPPGVKRHTKQFIKHLARDPKLRNAPLNKIPISVHESNDFWKHMTEKVSSSQSTRHIGTYKAACLNNTNATIQAHMMSIPYETGTPLPCTTKCINVSLKKQGKGITPSELRTIWLMEADLNAGAKIHFVRRMMNETAIGNNLIPPSQYAKKKVGLLKLPPLKFSFLTIYVKSESRV